MATIKLTNIRTGVSYNYPLAYLDLSDTTGLNFQEGQQFGAHLSANCAEIDPAWESRPEAEKKIYKLNTNGLSPTLYLRDYIDPESSENLLHEPPTTTIASLFTPTALNEGVTWEEKPDDYDIYGKYYNPTGYVLGGVQLTCGGGSWQTSEYPRDPGPSLNRKWYESTRANQLYKTAVNTYFAVAMGLSSYQEDGRYTVGVVANCAQQWNSAASPEANAFPINNRSPYGELQCVAGNIAGLDSGYTRIGSYQSYKASHTVDSLDEEVVPCSKIATQMVYTKINDVGYVGCAVTLFEPATLGLRPINTQVTLYPAWLFEGLSGDFDPVEPVEPGEIPDLNPPWKDGSWSIPNSRAGIAEGPAASPLSGVGVDDAGLHLLVVKQAAMTQLTDKAWSSNDSQLASLTSGVISCGFIPQVFINEALRGHTAIDHFRVGTTNVTGLSNSAWLINDKLWVTKRSLASFDLTNRIYENYLDFEPYTSVTLTVPFCGEISIPASMCIGGSISVDMTCNMTNGDVVATVTCTSGPQAISKLTNTIPPINNIYMRGNCLSKFPVAGMSNGMNQFMSSGMQLVGGILNTAGNIATGNVAGALTGGMQMAQGIYGISNSKNQPVVNGAPIGSVGLIDNKKCFITIKTVAPAESNEFDAYHPYFMNKWVEKLSDYSGKADSGIYIDNKWNLFTVTDIHFEEKTMTSTEQERIKSLLREGVLI